MRLLLAASLACKVKVTFPPETTVAEDTETTEFTTEGAPGFTVTVGKVEEMVVPPIVAPMLVGVPETDPVKLAV